MTKNLLLFSRGNWLAGRCLALVLLLSAGRAGAQTIKTLPGDYANFTAAIIDINANFVAGGVTVNVAAGYTETPAAALPLLTAQGTGGTTGQIIFQKFGSGANPKITASAGTSTTVDGIVRLSGADYVTFDGIDLSESAANTTANTSTAYMEFGYALFRPTATNGCQNNTFRNCVITLNKTNSSGTGTFGIYGAGGVSTATATVTATSTAGANSGNKINGCVITNSLTGIYFTASTVTALANYDLNNEIGVVAANQIYNFGGAASGWGIGGNYQNGFKVVNNTVNSMLNYAGGTTSAVAASTVTSTLRGVYGNAGPSASLDITGNTITLASNATANNLSGIDNAIGSTPASNTVNITGNTITNCTNSLATTAAMFGIVNTGAPTTLNITGNFVTSNTMTCTTAGFASIQNTGAAATVNINTNTISGNTITATTGAFTGVTNSVGSAINLNGNSVLNNTSTGTGTMTLIASSLISATTPVSISNNTITGNSKAPAGTSVSASLLCVTLGTALTTITGNTINNNSIVTSGSSTTAGTLAGLNSTAGSPTSEILTGNVITNLTISGTSTATTHVIRGLLTSTSGASVQTITGNTIGGLAISSGSGTVTGLSIPSGGASPGSVVSRNKIYDLSATGTAGSVNGLTIAGGGTYLVSNNFIGDLRTPAATGLLAVAGLNLSSGTQVNAYYNTIYLNASSSGATFGTSGILFGSTSPILDLRNNIVVNTSTGSGAASFGFTAALRRSSGTAATVPANYATTSNNNLFWTGTPSATNLIYVEGAGTPTNAQQTLAAHKAFMANRDQASVSENPPFLSTTGTAATFLHINPAVATQVESGGAAIAGITTDFDGDARNATTPDIGADEGSFTPSDLTPPSITYTALASTSSTANRTLVATITDASGLNATNAPRIYYRLSTGSTYYSALATSVAGSSYTFTIDYANIGGTPAAGATIQYYVAAQDASPNANVGTSPSGGSGTSPTIGITPPTTPASYQILPTLAAGNYYVGTSAHTPAATYATLTAAAAAYNGSGLAGAVNFILIDPTYTTAETFPITFNANGDASAANRLTISPEAGVNATISGSNTTALLLLNGADYVTLDGSNNATTTRNLTLSNAGAAGTTVLLSGAGAGGGATNDVLRNLNITASSSTSGFGISVGGATGNTTGADNDNITIQNNSIQQALLGIYVGGTAAVSAGGADGLSIAGNVIGPVASGTGNIGSTGMFLANAVAASVAGNTVQNIVSATVNATGISLAAGFVNGVVDRNRVLNIVGASTGGYGGKGINVNTGSASSNLRISNNFVAGLTGSGWSDLTTDAIVGIRILGTTGGVNLYYNSVNLSGSYSAASASVYQSAALYVASTVTALDVRDNVFANTLVNGTSASKAYAFYSSAAKTAFTTINYNDYFVGTGTQAFLGNLGGAGSSVVATGDMPTLAAFQASTGTGQDVNSLNVDPAFTSATDLHTSAPALNAAATPIAGITTDLDGDTRDAATPDMGADEFTPSTLDLRPTALAAPAAGQICFTSTEPVTVTIQNNASGPVDFAVNNATVTVSVTGAATQTFTATLTSGTLAAGATQNVTLGTLNMTALGTYSFAVTATVAGDGNTANDNITATRTNAAPQAALPYLEQFNTSATPANFTLSGGFATSTAANNGSPASSYGLRVNIYGSNTTASATTPILGTTTSSNNVLTFDGRFLVFGSTAGYALTGTDRVDVQVAICGGAFATVYTINSTNYNGTGTTSGSFYTYNVPLTGVGSGQKVQVRLVATYGSTSGDFYVDVDNINVRSVFSTDLTPTALLAPSATQGCYGAAETVTVTVKNQGTTALDFTANPATVTVNVTGATTATLTGGIATGTLAPGATQDVTLTPTLNMSTAGTYTFAINATVTGDQNTANDNLTATRTATAPVAGTLAPGSTTLCNSGTATLTLTGSANGSIQYQQSSSATGPFTNVATGGTTATYTTPVLTQTTYYRAQTTCGTNVATSNVATVTVNTPLIASTNSPQTICSGSTATVTANGSSGTTVRFFAASAGGTALATGTAGAATASYTTPALTANTTYYAEAFTGGTEVVGKTAPNTTGTLSSGGLVFNVTGATMLKTVTVYSVGASGTVSIQLQNAAGTVLQTGTGAVAAGTTAAPVASVITLNFNLVAGTGYKLIQGGGTAINLVRDDNTTGNNTYPYTSPSGKVSITDGTLSGYYYSFYNWQLSTECASATRTPVQVNVNPQPTATASNNGPICAGSTATVSFALTGTGPWNLTYSDGTTSTPVTGITTSPYTFTTGALSASTTYTVTALSDANCTATASPVASTIVTVRPLPTFSTTQTNVGCFGSSTGSITVTAAGGTAPYEYSINNGVTYTASATNPYTFTGLAAGTYQVLVKGQFCTAATAQAVTISQPASALSVTAAATDASSSTANDGSVTASASGGTSGYQYSLDATTYQPTGVFSNLAPGMYAVTAKDANGCTAQSTTVTVGTAASVCTTTTYTGAAPNDGSNWFNAANWTACVPTRTVDATIPGGLANYPALTTQATAEVRTLTIASGGSLAQSAGILAVYGNLSNSGTTTLTGGMVSLRGSSPTVTGVSTFYALEVDLSGGTMALSNATSISSGLTMKTGVLSTSSFTLTLLTGSLLSETESSYLLGTVIVPDRTLTAGTAESFSGIGLVLTPAVGSVSPGLTPVVRTTGTALTGAGSSVSITRYFDIQPATNTGLNVDMVFSYFTHEQNGIPTGSLALFKSVTTTSGPWANQSPITAGIKTISKAGITDFSIWTLGNLGAPLPVELTRFEATRAGSDAALAWSTATEKNSRGFEVQVSTDGRSYRVLSFVASPTAASTSPREYAYLDREASKAGLRYYRLRQLDLDGTATFSPVRTLRFEGKDARSFTAAPNPFRERLTLTVELPAGLVAAPALLSLTDAAGRSLLTQRTPALPAGTSQLELPDLAPLASGVYFVHLAVPGQPVQHLKVVKE